MYGVYWIITSKPPRCRLDTYPFLDHLHSSDYVSSASILSIYDLSLIREDGERWKVIVWVVCHLIPWDWLSQHSAYTSLEVWIPVLLPFAFSRPLSPFCYFFLYYFGIFLILAAFLRMAIPFLRHFSASSLSFLAFSPASANSWVKTRPTETPWIFLPSLSLSSRHCSLLT